MKFFLASLAIVGLVLGGVNGASSRSNSRSNSRSSSSSRQDCEITPETDENSAVAEGDTIRIECTFSAGSGKLSTCDVNHDRPDRQGSGSSDSDLYCIALAEGDATSCTQDPSVTLTASGDRCIIEIRDSNEDHTGEWRIGAQVHDGQNNKPMSTKHVEIVTYKEGQLEMQDADGGSASSIQTTYNWNERQEDWEDDKGGWERFELQCEYTEGRPIPHIVWFFEGNENNPIDEDDDRFDIQQSDTTSGTRNQWTRTTTSRIQIEINRELMDDLEREGVDTNQKGDRVQFDIGCRAELDLSGSIDEDLVPIEEVTISVEKSYDNGALPAKSIGLIVGIILAVLVLIVAIAIVLFLKSSGRACFAMSDYDYNDPRDAKSQPMTAGRQHQQRR